MKMLSEHACFGGTQRFLKLLDRVGPNDGRRHELLC
jgi:hypothetical protein